MEEGILTVDIVRASRSQARSRLAVL